MKKIIAIVALLLSVTIFGLWLKGREMHEISTEIEIAAPPAKVWETLMNFNQWSDWNPIVISAEGESNLGASLSVTMKGKDGGNGPKYAPKITELAAPNSMRWRAKMGAEFIFTNDKVFQLEETANGTKLTHKELFKGLMLPIMCNQLDKGVPVMLDAMNQALKDKIEGSKS